LSTRTNLRLGGLAALALLALALLASLLPAGSVQAATEAGSARLRAVHAVANFGPVDVYVNGAAVLSSVPFFTVSDYLTLAPGSYLVQVIPAGDKLAKPKAFIINKRYRLAAGADYSLVARGLAGTLKLGPTLLKDTNAAPAEGKANLRVAHVASDLHEVDVYINGEKTISALSFRGTSPYLSVAPGTYTVGVAKAGEQPFFTGRLTLAAGQVVTAWANGQRLPTPDGNPFTVTPSVDAQYEQGQARVRAVHAIPDIAGSPVDVYIDNAKVVTFDFFKVTDYLPIAAGPHTVRVVLAGGNPATEAVISADVTLAADTDYSLIARGTGGDFGATALVDDNSRPAIGQARVRAAHFSPDAPAVDVYVNGTKTISGLSFKSASDYLSVPAGTYTLGIAPAGGAVIFSADATLKAGQVVTVWANGLLAGTGKKAFTLTPTVDANFPQARVRLLHAVPDAPAVDIFLNGERVAAGLSFGTISGYLPVFAGTYNVQIKPAGGSAVVFSGSITVEGGASYTAAAIGLLAGSPPISVVLFKDIPADVGDNQARLQVINLSPDAPAVDVLAGKERLSSGLGYQGRSSIVLGAGAKVLRVVPQGGGTDLLSSRQVLAAGSDTTLFVVGLASQGAPAGAKMRMVSARNVAGAPQQVSVIYLPLVVR
jgi:hypothetical protein